jgi:16S rRNA (cytosine967-C5)-methyltransferase
MSSVAARPRPTAREVAFQVVRDVFGPEQRGAPAAVDVRTRRAELDPRDRSFAAELAYGSIKQRRLIDWYLKPYVGGREKALPPAIVDVLRLGVYQLRFMSGVDDHAAVSETVNLAWKHGHKGTAGLVNAVLRRMIADGRPQLDAADFKSDDDFAGTAYSVPTWIAAQYGRAFNGTRDIALAGINSAPQSALRVNALRGEMAEVEAALAQRGLTTRRSPFVAETLILEGGGGPGEDPGGRWAVQGEAAGMPVDLLAPQPGETILELCSGRGNKTVQIAARMNDSGTLVCVERDEKKIAVLEETLQRARVTLAAIVVGDAAEAAAEIRADGVLLDAPCSGVGVIGRHPEARWRKTPEDGARLATVQAALLRAAAERTKPGGRLVYSVCSNDPREGSAIVDAFLAENASFARAPLPERYAPFARDGDVVVTPGVEGRDGFYIALLARAA